MRFRLNINGKMLLYILGTAVLVYALAFSYIAIQIRTSSIDNSVQIINGKAIEITNDIQVVINRYSELSIFTANVFSNYNKIVEPSRRELFAKVLYSSIEDEDDCQSVWAEIDPLTIDNRDSLYANTIGSTVIGNFDYRYYRADSLVYLDDNIKTDISKICAGSVFSHIKTTLKYGLVDPSLYSDYPIREIKIVAPVVDSNKFIGAVGVDISVDIFMQLFDNLNTIEGAKYFIISSSGDLVAKSDSLNLSNTFSSYAPNIEKAFNVNESIALGTKLSFEAKDPITGEKKYFIFTPIVSGNSDWTFCMSVPSSIISYQANQSLTNTIISALVGFVILLFAMWRIAYSVSNPLKITTTVLQNIAQGNIKNIKKLKFIFNDEINDLAGAINKLISGLNSSAEFAQQIGEGNLNADYKLLGDKDALGKSLIEMQNSLILAKSAADIKRIEDEKRNWVTHGLAKFGEVIRQHNDNMGKFTMNIAKNLVDYVDVSQVAVYINKQIENENQDTDIYELKSVVAYGKAVMLKKEFKVGHELLGRSVDEQKTIHLQKLPSSYVSLSPGMKDEKKPDNLLIIPMCINNVAMGALELLSYNVFQSHQIDFLEKLCENIASVIASVQINISTVKLLEQSQHQADELAQHEEEMRQNLEEMQATQEEAAKKQDELNAYIKTVKDAVMLAELNASGRIVDVSSSMSAVYGASTDNMRGNYFEGFVAQDKSSQTEFAEFWKTMIAAGSAKRKHVIKKRTGDLVLLESYTVIKKDGFKPKVLIMVVDKTKEKEMKDLLKAEVEAT